MSAIGIQLDEDRLRRLMEAGSWLIAQLELEAVLDRLLQTAREVTGARYAALGVLDAERRELERFLTRGLTDEQERAIGPRPRGQGILGLLIADPKPVRIADLSSHPDSFGFPAHHPSMHSFLGVPIIIGGAAWGNLYLTDKDGEFEQADEQAVTILAAWAAIAIEHARALTTATERQRALEQTLSRLEAMQTIAVAVGAETDLSKVLELVAKRGRVIAEARSFVILLQDGDEPVLTAGAGHVEVRPGVKIPVAGSTSGEVMSQQKPLRITDLPAGALMATDVLGLADARTAMLVPLVYHGRALGVLMAFDREDADGFTEQDEQVMMAFAASAATAVATAQTVQAERLRHSLEAAEAERKRWARELHDETLQALGGLKVIASSARRQPDPELVAGALDQLVAGLEVEIENLHSIISTLRPAALDDFGLRPAIDTLAEHYQVANGLEVRTQLELPDPTQHERRLSAELEVTIYRLVQEALTNIAKHARANLVEIAVSVASGRVAVRVRDDGGGFDLGHAPTGFGLTGIRERVELAGGELTLLSSADGTTVAAVLPVSYAS